MKRTRIRWSRWTWVAALLLSANGFSAPALGDTEEPAFTLLERELAYLMTLWPGDYDNQEQLRFEADWQLASGERHRRVHSTISRVELPAFGEHALYVEEYWDAVPRELFRQRLYVLSADEEAGAIRVQIRFFNDGQPYLQTRADAQPLTSLRPEDTLTVPGCDVLMRRDLDAFIGGMSGKDCHFGEREEHRYTEWQMRIDSDAYWFRDRERSFASDAELMSLAGYTWYKLERARRFVCMIDVPRETGGRPVRTAHYVPIHDQGGQYSFEHPDGRAMTLVMRNFWSHEMQRETFTVVVTEGPVDGPTLVYGWGAPGADRIGVNPGWIRIQCDLDTSNNRTLQHRLRPDS